MVANGKIRMTFNTSEEPIPPLEDGTFVADVVVEAVKQTGYSLLEIRVIMPKQRADDLLLAMVLGTAEFAIEEMEPLVTQH